MFGLEPDISLIDSPVKPGDDKKEKSRGVTKKIEGTGMTEEKKKLSNDRNKYFI